MQIYVCRYTNFLQHFDWDTHKHWEGHRKQTDTRSCCKQCTSRHPSEYQRATFAGRKRFFRRVEKNHKARAPSSSYSRRRARRSRSHYLPPRHAKCKVERRGRRMAKNARGPRPRQDKPAAGLQGRRMVVHPARDPTPPGRRVTTNDRAGVR